MNKLRASLQSGFTMMEIMLVVFAAALGLIAMVAMLGKANDENRIRSTDRLLGTIATEANAYRTVNGSYSGIGCNLWETSSPNCKLVQKGVLKSLQSTPYGGHISLGEDGATADGLNVAFQKIPPQACLSILLDANQNKNISKIQLYQGTQDIIIDAPQVASTGATSCGPDPNGGGRVDPDAPVDGTGAASCNGDSSGYNLTVISSFPISPAQASGYCSSSSERQYTFVWTFS